MPDDFLKKMIMERTPPERRERASRMLEMDEDSFVESEWERMMLREEHQNLVSDIHVRNYCSKSDQYPVVSARVTNTGAIPEGYCLRVVVDDHIFIEDEGTCDPGSVREWLLFMDPSIAKSLNGRDVSCRATVSDSHGREIAFTEGILSIVPSMEGLPIPTGSLRIEDGKAVISISSISSREMTVVAKICSSNGTRSHNLRVPPKSDMVYNLDLETGQGDIVPKVYLEFDGVAISEHGQVPVKTDIEQKELDAKLFAECRFESIMDVNRPGNTIPFAAVLLKNRENRKKMVAIEAFFDGERVHTSREAVGVKDVVVFVSVPVTRVRSDNTSCSEARVVVYDGAGTVILDRSSSIIIRSRHDMRLTEVREQTARFVSPHLPEIRKLVDQDGLLSEKLKGGVAGYQNPDEVFSMMEAVFEAVKSHRMRYVSDTATIGGGEPYQRVRDPATVMKDHSGNCIEFSILFASFFETMGLEPVVVFPKGHAIVGVVFSTDMYRSGSRMVNQLSPVMITLRDGKRFANVLCFESTCCTSEKVSFKTAVAFAKDMLDRQLNYINTERRFSMIGELRERNIQPRVD